MTDLWSCSTCSYSRVALERPDLCPNCLDAEFERIDVYARPDDQYGYLSRASGD